MYSLVSNKTFVFLFFFYYLKFKLLNTKLIYQPYSVLAVDFMWLPLTSKRRNLIDMKRREFLSTWCVPVFS